MNALIKNVNTPSVSMFSGRVRMIKTGLIKTLINPKRAAARIVVRRESTLIPGTTIEAINIAPVIISQRVIIDTINLPPIPILNQSAIFVGCIVGFLNVCTIHFVASSLPPRYHL
jgi:hypothetical protein